jgi:hypothetical protein
MEGFQNERDGACLVERQKYTCNNNNGHASNVVSKDEVYEATLARIKFWYIRSSHIENGGYHVMQVVHLRKIAKQ